jgi:DNA polymerase I-like protein with 3'-5' exonuclease and polymerase domains
VAKKTRSFHVGGEQLPLITPASSWCTPTELPDLRRVGVMAEDLETHDPGLSAGRGPSWPYEQGHICGVSVAWREGLETRTLYVPTRHPDGDNFPEDQVARWLTDLHRAPDLRIVFQNGQSYDHGWNLVHWRVPVPLRVEDTVAAAVMVDENRFSYELDELCRWRGIAGKDETLLAEAAAAYGFSKKAEMWKIPARYVGPYAEQDARATLELFLNLEPTMIAEKTHDAYRLEMDLIPLTVEMRRRGVRVNIERATQLASDLEARRDDYLERITDLLGHQTGIDDVRSPLWCERTFDALKIPYGRTPTGQGSFQRKQMLAYEGHPLPALIARAELAEEMASKFVRGMIIGYSHRGRVHACVNQFRSEEGGTRSHRFSYSDPALQQAPNRDEEMSEMFRGSFEPEEGEIWGALDYSQQEYRHIVDVAFRHGCDGAAEAVEAYRANPKTDFHVYVAEITELDRKPAKDANFAKAFGAGVAKFASMIGRTREEASLIYEQYDRELPFVKQVSKMAERAAQTYGYVTLSDGARCHFDLWEVAWREEGEPWKAPRPLKQAEEAWPGKRLKRAYTHKALNRKIQGSAARQTKAWMRECYRAGIVPLLQMHDELDFSFADEQTANRVVEMGRDVLQLSVPMAVDAEFGVTWGAARKVKRKDADGRDAVTYGATWREAAAARGGAVGATATTGPADRPRPHRRVASNKVQLAAGPKSVR